MNSASDMSWRVLGGALLLLKCWSACRHATRWPSSQGSPAGTPLVAAVAAPRQWAGRRPRKGWGYAQGKAALGPRPWADRGCASIVGADVLCWTRGGWTPEVCQRQHRTGSRLRASAPCWFGADCVAPSYQNGGLCQTRDLNSRKVATRGEINLHPS